MSEQITTPRFSHSTTEMLQQAGWFPGRDVFNQLLLPSDFIPFPAALHVLREFGYIKVGKIGPGKEYARSLVVMDPMQGVGESDDFGLYAENIGAKLYPLGVVHSGPALLAIDEYGRVFLVFGGLYFVDDNFDAAIDNLLNGLRQTRMVDAEGHW